MAIDGSRSSGLAKKVVVQFDGGDQRDQERRQDGRAMDDVKHDSSDV